MIAALITATICATALTLAWWLRSYLLTIAEQQRDDTERHLRMKLDHAERDREESALAISQIADIQKRLRDTEALARDLSNRAELQKARR